MEKQDVDIGVRKEPSTAKTAQSDERETCGAMLFRGDDLVPEPLDDRFDQASPLLNSGTAIAGSGEILIDARRFFGVKLSQFVAQ